MDRDEEIQALKALLLKGALSEDESRIVTGLLQAFEGHTSPLTEELLQKLEADDE